MRTFYRIVYIEANNFIGLYNGLHRKKFSLDLHDLMDEQIIFIEGGNAKGKTTLETILHALPGTSDNRKKYIREGKEGYKEVIYHGNNGYNLVCKIHYIPTKTGHSVKAYLDKVHRGTQEVVELNPSGLVRSYESLVEEELGLTQSVLKLSAQSNMMQGYVNMTATERKKDMSELFPMDRYLEKFNIFDDIFKELNQRMKIVVDYIGNSSSRELIEETMADLNKQIRYFNDQRDKAIGKIKEFDMKIDRLNEEGDLAKICKELRRSRDTTINEMKKLRSQIDFRKDAVKYVLNGQSPTTHNITMALEVIQEGIGKCDIAINVLESRLVEHKTRRNGISEDLEAKSGILQDISSDSSLDELKKIRDGYVSEFEKLDKAIKGINVSVSRNELITGYDIVGTLRGMIENVLDNNADDIRMALSDFESPYIKEEVENLNKTLRSLDEVINKASSEVNRMESESHLGEILKKRPEECVIDDCPFIVHAQKWTYMEQELEKFATVLEEASKKKLNTAARIEELSTASGIVSTINNILTYIDINSHLINKLPYSKRYKTKEAILTAISKADILIGCDNFETAIEILESVDDHKDLLYRKIPAIENEINLMESHGSIIEITRKDVERLTKELSEIKTKISTDTESLKKEEELREYQIGVVETLKSLHNVVVNYDELSIKKEDNDEDLVIVEEALQKLEKYSGKRKEWKETLKEAEKELKPRVLSRDSVAAALARLDDYENERDFLTSRLDEVGLCRDSVSIKEGIPMETIGYRVEQMRQTANSLLSRIFGGELQLRPMKVSKKEFKMPFVHGAGETTSDISDGSGSQRTLFAIALSMALMEVALMDYKILLFDEVDGSLTPENREMLVEMLKFQIHATGVAQVFIITHNRESYISDTDNVAYILFPGHTVEKDELSRCNYVKVA